MFRYCSLIIFLLNAYAFPGVAQTGCWEIIPLTPGCPPLDLQLVDCSDAVSSEWNVNGQAFSGDTIIYTVVDTGYYSITLVSTFVDGSDTTLNYNMHIGPIGDFTITPNELCEYESGLWSLTGVGLISVHFNIYNDSGNLVFSGMLGGGFGLPPYYFSPQETGCYSFEQIIIDGVGCRDTVVKEDYVCVDPIIADFSIAGNDSVSCPPLIATFENTSSCFDSAICNCIWDFGDGSPLVTGCHPTHTYLESGSFNVTMITMCGGVSDTIVKENFIEVGGAFANITTIIDDPCGPVTVCYVLDSTNSISFLFCPGNNTTCQTGPFDTLCITYDSLGAYEPSILICDNVGCCFEKFLDSVYVDSVHAAFGALQNVVCGSDPVQFYNSSFSAIGTIASYHWNFGDGNTSTLENPIHVYADTGCYDVTLTTTGFGGCYDTMTLIDIVCVVPGVEANVVADTALIACNPPYTICFDASSSIGSFPLAFEWSAGTLDIGPVACYTFNTAGSYPVDATVMDVNGCSDNATFNVTIATTFVNLTASNTTMEVGDSVIFSASPPVGAGFIWTVSPDSNVVQSPMPFDTNVIQFLQEGVFTVCVDAFYPGCNAQDCITITVNDTLASTNPLFNNDTFTQLIPNPTSHQAALKIQGNSTENISVNVLSIDGKILSTLSFNLHQGVNKIKLDVTDLPNGVYMLQVKSPTVNATRKLVVQR